MRNIPRKIFIIGNGGHARSIADIILHDEPSTKLAFLDQNAQQNETIFGFPCYKEILESFHHKCIVAVGDNKKRKSFFATLKATQQYSVVSSLACISNHAQVKKGCFIGNFTHIGPEVAIGENSIINTSAIIEHETKIGSHSHVAPNAIVAGRVTIGELVFVGCGATIINNVTICSQVIIGAGSTVINDISEPGTYVGCPAKKVYYT